MPPDIPEYKLLYEVSERNDIMAGNGRNIHSVAPFRLALNFQENIFLKKVSSLQNRDLLTYIIPAESFRVAGYSRAKAYESLRGGVIASPFNRTNIYAGFHIDETFYDDPNYTGKKWRGIAGEIDNAFINYEGKNLDIIAGRFSSNWGYGINSLVLSSTACPMDAFSAKIHKGRIFFTYQIGQLQRLSYSISPDQFENRYFSGHRLDLRISNNLHLGFFETIVYGGVGRNIEFAYINPFMFFHSNQLNDNVDDNVFLGFDFALFLKSRHKLSGQVLIDDYQIESDNPGDKEPNEVGLDLKWRSIDVIKNIDFELEYLRITNRTYNQPRSLNRYENRGKLIGHEFGCDGDRLSISAIKWFDYLQRMTFNLSYQRKGKGNYNDPWSTPWDENPNYQESFPSGAVEGKWNANLQFTGYLHKYGYLDLNVGLEFVDNFSHIIGNNKTIPYLSGRLSLPIAMVIGID